METNTTYTEKKILIKHGHTRIDNYYWMNDLNNKKVLDFLKEENTRCQTILSSSEAVNDKIYSEILKKTDIDYVSLPLEKNEYYYFYEIKKQKPYPIYFRVRKNIYQKQDCKEVILDVNNIVENEEYGDVTNIEVSDCEKYMIYSLDKKGNRRYDLYVKNIKTHITRKIISNITSNVIWGRNEKEILFTSMENDTLRNNKVYLFNLKNKRKKLLYEEIDKEFYVYIEKSKSKKYIYIISCGKQSTEYKYIDLSKRYIKIKNFKNREKNVKYYIEHVGKYFIFKTNKECKNFKICKISIENIGKESKNEKIKTVINEKSEHFIIDFDVFDKYITLITSYKNKKYLKIFDINNGNFIDEVKFKDEVYEIDFSLNTDMSKTVCFFYYTSLHTPKKTYAYDFISKKIKLIKENVVPSYQKDLYQVERIHIKSRDNKSIPISALFKKNLNISLKKENKTGKKFPVLIYVYGAYGSSVALNFSGSIFSLVDRGFIYVIAHVRGGKELGPEWYDDGRLLNKKNTFFDLIDCSEWLIKKNYTDEKKLCLFGGSAGGLTVSATVNMKPEIFSSVVSAVPFVDVVTTMLDENIPLTTNEYHEWGNPNIREYYYYMLSYSPYDNIVNEAEYPNMLLTTALFDSQVQYWEAAKMLAKLKNTIKNNKIILLKSNLSSGHSGHSDKFLYYKEIAYIYRFFLHTLKLI